MKKPPTILELGNLMRKVQNPNKKTKNKVIEAAALICPQFAKVEKRNPVFGELWPDREDVLAALAYRAIETHPDIYKSIRCRQINNHIGIGSQFDSACFYDIPITRIHPDLFDMMTECEPPIDTQLMQAGTTPRFPTEYFVVPKGKLTVEKKAIILIGVTCLTPELNEQLKKNIFKRITGSDSLPATIQDGLIFISALTDGIEEYYSYHPLVDGVIQKKEAIRDHTNQGMTEDEKNFLYKLLSLGIQTILLHNHHPEWDIPEREESQCSGSGKFTKKLHTRILGGKFPHKGLNRKKPSDPEAESDDGTQTSRKRPCEHWKGWHWKDVLHGPNRSLRTKKLILPYRVNEGLK